MKKRENRENRFCFFDYHKMREKEAFKLKVRTALLTKLTQYRKKATNLDQSKVSEETELAKELRLM
jgi:hypothetical protein